MSFTLLLLKIVLGKSSVKPTVKSPNFKQSRLNISLRKSLCVMGLCSFVISTSSAQDIFIPSGQQLTKGQTVSTTDYFSSAYNPAAPSYLVKGKSGINITVQVHIATGKRIRY